MKFDLQRMRHWLSEWGNPQDQYPSIHVAGTNGKGSVVSCLAQMLMQSGLRVGVYTSPHLERVNERFRINNRLISDNEFRSLSHFIKKISGYPTEFEFHTLLAFLWFARENVDVAVLEVGLGGRLDATNVVRHVLASVITHIDLDHTQWLGPTIEKIAYEKAGIIKPHVPVLTMATGAALQVISTVAKKYNAPLIVVRPPQNKLPIPLLGQHQQKNAALAAQTIRTISEFIPKWRQTFVAAGLRSVSWPGRFEKISGRSLIILDGAHNPDAIRALVATLKMQNILKVNLIFGVLKDKNDREMIRTLSPLINSGFVVTVASDRSADPKKIAGRSEWKNRISPTKDWKHALDQLEKKKDRLPILVCGSLYLVGAVRAGLKKRSTRIP